LKIYHKINHKLNCCFFYNLQPQVLDSLGFHSEEIIFYHWCIMLVRNLLFLFISNPVKQIIYYMDLNPCALNFSDVNIQHPAVSTILFLRMEAHQSHTVLILIRILNYAPPIIQLQ
jgi:hypothetical protein